MATLSDEGRKTLWGILALAAGLIVWDFLLLTDGEPDTTISAVLRITSRILFMPYAFGFIAGHVYWNKEGPRDDAPLKVRFTIAAIIGLAFTGLALALPALAPVAYLCEHPQIVFVVGFVLGHYLWPQYKDGVGA